MVVLLSATWAGPSRPAPTVLRELHKRWGGSVGAVLIEDPDDAVIDALGIEVVPTWLRFEPAPRGPAADPSLPAEQGPPTPQCSSEHGNARSGSTGPEGGGAKLRPATTELEVEGMDPLGRPVTLSGAWLETHRRTGAAPKHLIDREFGPVAAHNL